MKEPNKLSIEYKTDSVHPTSLKHKAGDLLKINDRLFKVVAVNSDLIDKKACRYKVTVDLVAEKETDFVGFKGSFSVINGHLDLHTTNRNISFEEAETAMLLVRNEIQRILDNKDKCPFYKTS